MYFHEVFISFKWADGYTNLEAQSAGGFAKNLWNTVCEEPRGVHHPLVLSSLLQHFKDINKENMNKDIWIRLPVILILLIDKMINNLALRS